MITEESYAEIGWAGWMASFNGRFFSGGYSGHKVVQKNRKTRDYITEQINNTLSQIPLLNGIEFNSGKYYDVVIPKGSIVYCDIPYKGTKQYETSKDFDYEKFY
jgi:DNA adenine methylase